MSFPTNPEDICSLIEQWCHTVERTPSNQLRAEATENLMKFRESQFPYDICMMLLNRSHSQSALLHSLLTMKAAIIREYGNTLTPDYCDNICASLLSYAVERVSSGPGLTPLIINNICHILAISHKRGWPTGPIDGIASHVYINGSTESPESIHAKASQFAATLCGNIRTMLSHTNLQIREFACIYATAVLQECATEKASEVGLNLAFHVQVHRSAEKHLLFPLVTLVMHALQACGDALQHVLAAMGTAEEAQRTALCRNFEQLGNLVSHAVMCVCEALEWQFEESISTEQLLFSHSSGQSSDGAESDETLSNGQSNSPSNGSINGRQLETAEQWMGLPVKPGKQWASLLLQSGVLQLMRQLYCNISHTNIQSSPAQLYALPASSLKAMRQIRRLVGNYAGLSGTIFSGGVDSRGESSPVDMGVLQSHLSGLIQMLELFLARGLTYYNSVVTSSQLSTHSSQSSSYPSRACVFSDEFVEEYGTICRVFCRLTANVPLLYLCTLRTTYLPPFVQYINASIENLTDTRTTFIPDMGAALLQALLTQSPDACSTNAGTGAWAGASIQGYVLLLLYAASVPILSQEVLLEHGDESVDTWGAEYWEYLLAAWCQVTVHLTDKASAAGMGLGRGASASAGVDVGAGAGGEGLDALEIQTVDVMGLAGMPGAHDSVLSVSALTGTYLHAVSSKYVRLRLLLGLREVRRKRGENSGVNSGMGGFGCGFADEDDADVFGNCEVEEQFLDSSHQSANMDQLAILLRGCATFSFRFLGEYICSYTDTLFRQDVCEDASSSAPSSALSVSPARALEIEECHEALWWLISLAAHVLCDHGDATGEVAMIPHSLIQFSVDQQTQQEDPLAALAKTVFTLVERTNVLLADSFLRTAQVTGMSIASTKHALLSPYVTQHLLLFLKRWGQAYLMPSIGIYPLYSPRLWALLGEDSVSAGVMLETVLHTVENVLLYWGEEADLCVLACEVLQALTASPRIRKHVMLSPVLPSLLAVFKIACFAHNSMMAVLPTVLTPQELPPSLLTVLNTWGQRSSDISLCTLSTLMRLQNPTLLAFAASMAACIQEERLPHCPVAHCLYSVVSYRVDLLSKHPSCTAALIASYDLPDEALFVEQVVTTLYLLRGLCTASSVSAPVIASLFQCYAPLLPFFSSVVDRLQGKYVTLDAALLRLYADVLEHHLGYYNNVQIVYVYAQLFRLLETVASPQHRHVLAHTGVIDGGLVIDNLPLDDNFDADDDNCDAVPPITGAMILTRILDILRHATSRLLVPVLDPIPQSFLSALPPTVTDTVTQCDMLVSTPITPDSVRVEIKTEKMKNALLTVFFTIVPFVSPLVQQDVSLAEAYYSCLAVYLKTCCLHIFSSPSSSSLSASAPAASSPAGIVLSSLVAGLDSVHDGIVKLSYSCIDTIARKHVDMCRQLVYIAQGNRIKGQSTKDVAVMVNNAVRHLHASGNSAEAEGDGTGLYLGIQDTVGLIPVDNVPYFPLLNKELLVECCPMSSHLLLLQADVDKWLSALPFTSTLSSLFTAVLSRILFSRINATVLYGEAADALYTLLTCMVGLDDIVVVLANTQHKCQQQLLDLLAQHQHTPSSLPFRLLPRAALPALVTALQQPTLTCAQRRRADNDLVGHRAVSQLMGAALQQHASSEVLFTQLQQLLQQLLTSAEENKPADCAFGYSLGCDGKVRRGRFKSCVKTIVSQVRAATQSK